MKLERIRNAVIEHRRFSGDADMEAFNANADPSLTCDEEEIASVIIRYERGEIGLSEVGGLIVGIVQE